MTSPDGDTMLTDSLGEHGGSYRGQRRWGDHRRSSDCPRGATAARRRPAQAGRRGPKRTRIQVDDAGALIELRDALAEAKPEDQGSILEQMHRIEALSRQRGKGDAPPVDRKSPYFGHLRLEESGKRRDVLIGARSFVEPGGRRADRRLAKRPHLAPLLPIRGRRRLRGTHRRSPGRGRDPRPPHGRHRRGGAAPRGLAAGDLLARPAQRGLAGDRRPAVAPAHRPRRQHRRDRLADGPGDALRASHRQARATRGASASTIGGSRRPDRHLPAIAALIDPRQFELITQPSSGLIAIQGSAGSGKTTIGLHRIAYLAFAEPRRFRPDKMLVIVYQRALAAYVSRVLAVARRRRRAGHDVLELGAGRPARRGARFADTGLTDDTPPAGDAGQGARRLSPAHRRPPAGARRLVPGPARDRARRQSRCRGRRVAFWDRTSGPVDLRVTALATWLRDTPVEPPHATRSRTPAASLRVAYPRRRRRVGVAPHRPRRARRGLRTPRPGRVLPGPARRHSPLVRHSRSPAHGRPSQRGRRRLSRSTPRTKRFCSAFTSSSAGGCPTARRRWPTST